MKHLKYINLTVLLIIFFSCSEKKKNPDVSNVEVSINTKRFDMEMFEQNDSEIIQNSALFLKKYGTFYERYLQDLLNVQSIEDPMLENNIKMFIHDKDMHDVYTSVKNKYPDLKWLDSKLTEAFKLYKHYFPDSLVPEVVTFVSGLNYPVAASDSILGIGLDMYLGSDSEYYSLLGLPQYKIRIMNEAYIASDAVRGWLMSEIETDASNEDMLGQIVFQGKLLYMLNALLPETEDSVLIGYSKTQIEWCLANEANVWAHFTDKKLLFSNNFKEISQYTNEGPFTPGLPRESPGKVGVWLGWQLVNSFMEKQGKVDLVGLINTSPIQILNESKYKPKI